MKSICLSILLGAVALAGVILLAQPLQAQGIDCAAVGERVSTAVKANPDQVLTVVEDALVAYAECACEVVTAAINSSNGTADTVKQIVLVAVQSAQTEAPAIAECAVAAAPEHAEAVRLAFAEAFNGKEAPAVSAAAATVDPRPVTPEAATTTSTETATTTYREPVVTASEDAATEWTSGKDVVVDTLGGKDVVYGDPGYSDDYSSKAPVYDPPPAPAAFGAAPLTLSSAFLIPPVSASPIIVDEPEVIIKEVIRYKTRVRTKFVPRTVIRTVPVSPTSH